MEHLQKFVSNKFTLTLCFGGISALTAFTILRNKKEKNSQKKGKLYFHSVFRSNRCIWLLRELNALEDYELIDVDVWDKTSNESKSYTETVHPHTTVPALQYDDLTLLESGAICMHLAEKYNSLIPTDLGELYNILFYVCATLDEVQEKLFVQFFFNEKNGTEDKNEIEHATQKFNACAKYLVTCLREKEYICGDKFSVADCVLGYNMWWASEMKEGILIQKYPELLSYLERLKSRPAFQQTWASSKPVV
ncbi:uncharacterized protein LOC134726788 [Mytilus trossulus]|uniref:uncharacterized protein LOC134726788 n=1 Tax=Mytilus trossulus TaxID=6551 RepID=UPI0030074459